MNYTFLKVRKVCTDIMSSAPLSISLRALVNLIKLKFKEHQLEIEIRTKKVKDIDNSEFYVNAYYDAELDFDNECAIEIVIYHHILKHSYFETAQIGQFLVQIYDAVVHELRHREQNIRRQFKPNNRMSNDANTLMYLIDPDEIDAYSVSIAVELIRSLGKQKSMIYLKRASRLANIRPRGLFASPTLFHYFRVFPKDSKVLKKLVKKVFLNLEMIDTASIFY